MLNREANSGPLDRLSDIVAIAHHWIHILESTGTCTDYNTCFHVLRQCADNNWPRNFAVKIILFSIRDMKPRAADLFFCSLHTVNLVVSCRYFLSDSRSLFQPQSFIVLWSVPYYIAWLQRHMCVCDQLAQNRYIKMEQSGVELMTSQLPVQRPNHDIN